MRTRLLALGGYAVAIALAFGLGLDDALRDGGVERLATETGALGPVLFVLSMWLVQPLGVPGWIWMIPAGLWWDWPFAFALCWFGNMGASTLAFAFAQWVGRDWIERRMPPFLHRFDARLTNGGVFAVVVVRLLTGQLPPADWLLGVSGVRLFPTFLVGTAIGIVPVTLFFVTVGSSLGAWLLQQEGSTWLVIAAVAALVVVARRRIIARANERQLAEESVS